MNNEYDMGRPDHARINVKENYDVEYWTKTLNTNRERLKEAVNAVGTSAEDVRKYLK